MIKVEALQMSQTVIRQTRTKKNNRQNPENNSVIASLNEVSGIADVSGFMNNDIALEQATRLGDPWMQTIQRQKIVRRIGQMQGNHHLQRALGAHLQNIQRDPDPKQASQPAWSDASKESAQTSQPPTEVTAPSGTSWNAGKTLVGNIWRIPVEGLKFGNQSASEIAGRRGSTPESAVGKAIVLQHKNFKLDKTDTPVRVILHLHGFGAGYRQLDDPVERKQKLQDLIDKKAPKKAIDAGKKEIKNKLDYSGILQPGQVRDVDLYRMEQQLDALQQPQTMAILPQGTSSSEFGDIAAKPSEYIDDVFQKLEKKPTNFHIVLSAHSGGGFPIMGNPKNKGAADTLEEKNKAGEKNTQVDEIVLFDAINTPDQLTKVKKFIRNKLNAELAKVKAEKGDQKAWIEKNGFRFRGFYTPKFQKTDDKGNLMWKDPDTKKQPLMAGYGVVYEDLKADIEEWFRSNTKGLAADVVKSFKNNYQVFQVSGPHDKIVGATHDPSKKGVFHEALSALP
jgi:hypothetical protein